MHQRTRALVNRYVGNLPPMPGVSPDYLVPVIRNNGAGAELLTTCWGKPQRPRTGGGRRLILTTEEAREV